MFNISFPCFFEDDYFLTNVASRRLSNLWSSVCAHQILIQLVVLFTTPSGKMTKQQQRLLIVSPCSFIMYHKYCSLADILSSHPGPLMNLAIYKMLIQKRKLFINGDDQFLEIPRSAESLLTAARGLGAASDKGGEITVDVVAYMNKLLGLFETSDLGKLCVWTRQEVNGVIVAKEECVGACFVPFYPIRLQVKSLWILQRVACCF